MHIYADTANLADIERLNEHPWVTGFTTNPTLFQHEGVRWPHSHARDIVSLVGDKPVSIDGPPREVWSLGPNAIAKVYSMDEVAGLDARGPVNFTGICYGAQILHGGVYSPSLEHGDIVSVFAGRIMDTGQDPASVIHFVRSHTQRAQLLWASCRELYHVRMAQEAGCDIITMPPALIDKMGTWWGMPLEAAARLTLQQFHDDAVEW